MIVYIHYSPDERATDEVYRLFRFRCHECGTWGEECKRIFLAQFVLRRDSLVRRVLLKFKASRKQSRIPWSCHSLLDNCRLDIRIRLEKGNRAKQGVRSGAAKAEASAKLKIYESNLCANICQPELRRIYSTGMPTRPRLQRGANRLLRGFPRTTKINMHPYSQPGVILWWKFT